MRVLALRAVAVAACVHALAACAVERRSEPESSGNSAALLEGVREPSTQLDVVREEPTSSAPLATDPGIETIWAYLAQRYDGNGDARVSSAEYARDSAQFARWDRDGDGALTSTDFESPDRRGGARRTAPAGNLTTGKARRMLARYFQTDDDPGLLSLAEARSAFELYDGSDGSARDGSVTEAEFTCAMESRRRSVPGDDSLRIRQALGDAPPWATLLAGLDGDGDGELSQAEVAAFYSDDLRSDAIDYRGWSTAGPPRQDRAREARGPLRPDAAEGDVLAAQAGGLAPDFTLSSPDGGTTHTLSSFRGSKPVALIFGSYT